MKPSLDWSDPIAVSRWLAGLRLSWNDADAAARDMLRAPRKRQLGPALHAKNYRDARAQIRAALDFATPDPDDGDPSDPSGNGGSPAH